MEKIYVIALYLEQKGKHCVYRSKIAFKNLENAKYVANVIAKERNLYFQIDEIKL